MTARGVSGLNVIQVRLGPVAGARVLLPLVEAYLVRSGRDWVVIDTGPPGCALAILAAMKRHDIPPEAVSHILLTHGHFDHFGSAMNLRRALGAHVRIAMHPADRPFVTGRGMPSRLRPTSLAGAFPMFCGTLWMLAASATRRLRYWSEAEAEEVLWLDDIPQEASVDLHERLGLPLQALHTPGHSAGSLTFRLPTGELFTGDIVSHALVGNAPAWPLLADDPAQILPSLQRIAALRPAVVYPGHGVPIAGEAVTGLVERLSRRRKS